MTFQDISACPETNLPAAARMQFTCKYRNKGCNPAPPEINNKPQYISSVKASSSFG